MTDERADNGNPDAEGTCPSPPPSDSYSDDYSCGSYPSLHVFSGPTTATSVTGEGTVDDDDDDEAHNTPTRRTPDRDMAVAVKQEKMDDAAEPCAKRARVDMSGGGEGHAGDAEGDDDYMLADLTQMKPDLRAAASVNGEEVQVKHEEEKRERFAVGTRSTKTVAAVPVVWMNRQEPLFQEARHGSVDAQHLFTGIDFAFTGIPRTGAARQRRKDDLLGDGRPNSLDVGKLEDAVVAHGGRLLPSDDLSTSLHPSAYTAGLWGFTPTCVLIATTPLRTKKYIYALALGVPCIHVNWVQHCIDQQTLLPFQPYLLATGFSAERNLFCFQPNIKQNILKDVKLSVIGPPSFMNQWSCIIQAAGSTYIPWRDAVQRNKTAPLPEAVIVSSDIGEVHRAQISLPRFAALHFISPEWVFQCLVHQKKLPFTSNAHYRWDYKLTKQLPPATSSSKPPDPEA